MCSTVDYMHPGKSVNLFIFTIKKGIPKDTFFTSIGYSFRRPSSAASVSTKLSADVRVNSRSSKWGLDGIVSKVVVNK